MLCESLGDFCLFVRKGTQSLVLFGHSVPVYGSNGKAVENMERGCFSLVVVSVKCQPVIIDYQEQLLCFSQFVF